MEPWERKAHRLIAAAASQSRIQARGARKRHVPYSIPEWACELVSVLGWKDRAAAEIRAKEIFMRRHDLTAMRAGVYDDA